VEQLVKSYSASFVSQSYGNRVISIRSGQKLTLVVKYRNTGTATWYKGGSSPVYLGNSGPQDRISAFTGGNVRWQMAQCSGCVPGQIGTFIYKITAPGAGGYTEKFRPLAEHVTWMGGETTFTFSVK